jgi:hypothetical protein
MRRAAHIRCVGTSNPSVIGYSDFINQVCFISQPSAPIAPCGCNNLKLSGFSPSDQLTCDFFSRTNSTLFLFNMPHVLISERIGARSLALRAAAVIVKRRRACVCVGSSRVRRFAESRASAGFGRLQAQDEGGTTNRARRLRRREGNSELYQFLKNTCCVPRAWRIQALCTSDAGWSSPVARQAHNLKVTGSNPVPASKFLPKNQIVTNRPGFQEAGR